MTTAANVVSMAQSLIGIKMGTSSHHALVDLYNSVRPLPVGYAVKYWDDWCDVTVSTIFIKLGASDLIGRECGVERHIGIFKSKGIWVGKSFPKAGDIITFDWEGQGGFADHIGIVEKVEGNTVYTIEGNTSIGGVSQVGRRSYAWNANVIKGYARPAYNGSSVTVATQVSGSSNLDTVAKEIIAGEWGNGEERRSALLAKGYNPEQVQARVNAILNGDTSTPTVSNVAIAKEVLAGSWGNGEERRSSLAAKGYDPDKIQDIVNRLINGEDVQDTAPVTASSNAATLWDKDLTYNGTTLKAAHVNKLIALGRKYKILPELLICQLHLEAMWGTSNVAKLDNNWSGMTWSSTYVGNPSITKTKGSPRPAVEGGNYTHYNSVDDFFEDWVYLLRPGNIYQVSGRASFEEAVKGLFQVGGSRYDYAASGYDHYIKGMMARRDGIKAANGSDVFTKINALMYVDPASGSQSPTYKDGWNEDSNGWWYRWTDGSWTAEDWLKLDEDWFYFNAAGYALQNSWLKYKEQWFYFDNGCYMVTNKWVAYKDEWYWMDEKGIMTEDTMKLIDGKLYYFKKGGAMAESEEFTVRADESGRIEVVPK